MNPASTHFVLGYHGCDRKVAERVFAGEQGIDHSHNEWDWLGDGAYFWESNAQRAFEYAVGLMKHPRTRKQRIKDPAVVGAVVDLGFCLNLLDSRFIPVVRDGYDRLLKISKEAEVDLPKNIGGLDRLRRNLDCAVLRTVHQIRANDGDQPFDTVRAAFTEGKRSTSRRDLQPRRTFRFASVSQGASKGTFGRWTMMRRRFDSG